MERQAAGNAGLAQLQQGQGPSLDVLPPELASHILERLDVRSKCRMAQMNWLWRELAYHQSMWRKSVPVELRMRQSDVTPELFPTLTRRKVRRIKLAVSGPHVSAVLMSVPKLKSMIINRYMNDEGLELSSAFGHRPISNLTELQLIWCGHVTDATIADIAKNLTNLAVLGLTGCVLLTDAGLQHVANGLTRLISINLNYCRGVTDVGIGHLAAGRQVLDYLCISNCNRLTNDALRLLLGGQINLRILDASNCLGLMSDGARYLAEMRILVKVLMFGCVRVGDSALFHLARSRSLSTVNIGHCLRMTNAGLAHLKRSRITSLSLKLCPDLTDEGIAHVSRMSRLTKLVLSECYSITDLALAHLAEGAPGLSSLDIRGCSAISRWALMRVSFAFCSLKTLKLDHNHVNRLGLDRAARLLPSLSRLNIGGLDCIGVLRQIKTGCPLADRPLGDTLASQFLGDLYSVVTVSYADANFNRRLWCEQFVNPTCIQNVFNAD